jgi:hypothetical protein
VLSFAVGMTVGKLTDWGYFELSREISIIEALTLFTTIGLAIYISRVLEREAEYVRVVRGLYLSKISEIEVILRSLEGLLEDSRLMHVTLVARIQSCRTRKTRLCESIRASMHKTFKRGNLSEIDEFESNLSDGIIRLKYLMTETTRSESDDAEICLENGVISYSSNRVYEIGIEINDIVEQLFMMKIWIGNL